MEQAQEKTVSRKNFLMVAAVGAAGFVGLSALARKKIKTGTENALPFGMDDDSIFKPNAAALERMRKGLKK